MNQLTTKIVTLKSLFNLGLTIHFFDCLADKVIENGGFTVSIPEGLEPENKKYIVSLQGFESTSKDLTHEGIKMALLKYVYHWQDKFTKQGYFLGAWVENGALVLDISEGFSERYKETAIVGICKDRKQRAYFNLYTGKTVNV